MDTETSTTAEIASIASLPSYEGISVEQSKTKPLLSTSSTTNQVGYFKEILVRGTNACIITISLNVASEAFIQKNLAANRGPAVLETTANHEG